MFDCDIWLYIILCLYTILLVWNCYDIKQLKNALKKGRKENVQKN